MDTALKNILYLVLISAGTIFIGTQLNNFIQKQQDNKAKAIIISTIAKECQNVKRAEKNETSFHSASIALTKVLGTSVVNLDENSYLRILSFCYGEVPYGERK